MFTVLIKMEMEALIFTKIQGLPKIDVFKFTCGTHSNTFSVKINFFNILVLFLTAKLKLTPFEVEKLETETLPHLLTTKQQQWISASA